MSQYSVCVFCGSRMGSDPAFEQAAIALGRALARADMRLVYGAGDIGLMGAVANGTQAAGGQTFGVIPVHLLALERGKRDLTQFIVTENMHERKKVMFMNADALVTLPGGAGSLDELFEVLTWRQLGLHNKPIYLLDINGFWQPLLELIDHFIAQGFAGQSFRESLIVVDNIPALIAGLEASRRAG